MGRTGAGLAVLRERAKGISTRAATGATRVRAHGKEAGVEALKGVVEEVDAEVVKEGLLRRISRVVFWARRPAASRVRYVSTASRMKRGRARSDMSRTHQ